MSRRDCQLSWLQNESDTPSDTSLDYPHNQPPLLSESMKFPDVQNCLEVGEFVSEASEQKTSTECWKQPLTLAESDLRWLQLE